ncbi:MAG: NADH-quinone oxidoreductase subunit C [Gemmataceae bacterium]|nr:NADH-quinone oxidoreductase subunit C [Gemmataceae bacterium]
MSDILDAKFGDRIKAKFADGVVVEAGDLVEVMTYLRDAPDLKFEMLCDISGVDYLEIDPKKAAKAGYEPHLEVVYHLQSFQYKKRFTVKVMLPRQVEGGGLPAVPTLSGVFKIADWLERETFDLVGIDFTGHPNLQRILLSEDWEGHPLRKDYEFPLEYHGIRGR